MSYIRYFSPILLFVTLFVGSGIYFTLQGTANAFYQLSPLTAIIPAIALSWLLNQGNTEEKMHNFLDGVRHRDIITMCIIFLLAGAFSEVTKEIGSVSATVNLSLSLIPPQFILIGLFLTAAFISTAIGTSMGTIATIAPIAAEISLQGGFSIPLGIATVVGGAMFGDNLSIISDTTIAAVMSQESNMKSKLKLNAKLTIIPCLITLALLLLSTERPESVIAGDYTLWLISPYILLITLAVTGMNVFISLVISIAFAGLIGYVDNPDHDILFLSSAITKGFASMNEIMLLSLMVGGLSGLAGKGSQELAARLSAWIEDRKGGQKMAQLLIAKIVSLFDVLLANNTIAIIVSGEIARNISKKYRIPAHYSATWLDIFSCVFQGIIPYGAQILLASAIAGISPLSVTPYVYYCYLLGIVSTLHILFIKPKREENELSQA